MTYAIIAVFDQSFQENIQQIWRELAEQDLSYYASEVENREVHLTLASFETEDLSQVIEKLNQLSFSQMNLCFNSISTFLGSNMVTLLPVKTPELAKRHQQIHAYLDGICQQSVQYTPDCWVPHVTLANRVDENLLPATYQYVLSHFTTLTGKWVGIKLIAINEKKEVSDLYCQYF